MDIELDRYYTPLDLAENLISGQFDEGIENCVDTTCGSGNLLLAANRVLGDVKCIGLDRDRGAIAKLRRQQPDWVLSVADMLRASSYQRSSAVVSRVGSDLLLLNPPFSHGSNKSVSASYGGVSFKASVAMAHILKSFELFKPQSGALVIVPESVLYSETDQTARELLKKEYSVEVVAELHNTTFSGARVHSTVITIRPGCKTKKKRTPRAYSGQKIMTSLTRGGLPEYKLDLSTSIGAVPFLHTTGLSHFDEGKIELLPKTLQVKNGRISGPVILLPRVGVPSRDYILAHNLRKTVQLSDCVLALHFSNLQQARKAAARLRSNYSSLVGIYRGTGARYITIRRLEEWLISNGFHVNKNN